MRTAFEDIAPSDIRAFCAGSDRPHSGRQRQPHAIRIALMAPATTVAPSPHLGLTEPSSNP